MNSGVILRTKKKYAIVLTSDGNFLRVKNSNTDLDIGMEIKFSRSDIVTSMSWLTNIHTQTKLMGAFSLVAASVILFFLIDSLHQNINQDFYAAYDSQQQEQVRTKIKKDSTPSKPRKILRTFIVKPDKGDNTISNGNTEVASGFTIPFHPIASHQLSNNTGKVISFSPSLIRNKKSISNLDFKFVTRIPDLTNKTPNKITKLIKPDNIIPFPGNSKIPPDVTSTPPSDKGELVTPIETPTPDSSHDTPVVSDDGSLVAGAKYHGPDEKGKTDTIPSTSEAPVEEKSKFDPSTSITTPDKPTLLISNPDSVDSGAHTNKDNPTIGGSCYPDGFYYDTEQILTFEMDENGIVVEVWKEVKVKKAC